MHTREEIIKKAKDLAIELGIDSLSIKTFIAKTGISEWQIINVFDSWNEVVTEAGLAPATNIKVDDDELFQAMFDAFMQTKDVPTRRKFTKICRISASTYKRRFGKWPQILFAFRNWIKSTGKDFPYMKALEKQMSNSIEISKIDKVTTPRGKGSLSTRLVGSTRYGSFLNFRGLQHSPINEQGVIFLFGMICFELGYVVEAVRPDFPDCEAKRRIAGRKDQWEKVRIEFELQSKNFLEHGHNATNCDLIVCWEHNWTDCPIEVLELKKAIKELVE